MATFALRRNIAAPDELVFDVLTDHRGYARLTPLRSSTLEREGDPAPNGVGAIRVLALAGPPIREEVTEYQPPSRFAYKMLSGAPIRESHGHRRSVARRGVHRARLDRRLDAVAANPRSGVGGDDASGDRDAAARRQAGIQRRARAGG